MNWNNFILLIIGVYLGYYAVNILADLYLKKKAPGETTDHDILFFSEDSEPEIILYEDEAEPAHAHTPEAQLELTSQREKSYPAPVLESTGAVSLKDLIQAAQAGLIHYTKAIPY